MDVEAATGPDDAMTPPGDGAFRHVIVVSAHVGEAWLIETPAELPLTA
jgi:hypothetical protein